MSSLRQLIDDPNHDAYYMVDANMVIGYINNSMYDWNEYVDKISLRGKRLFIMPRIAAEITRGEIPSQFTILQTDVDHSVDLAYYALLKDLNIKDSRKLKTDVRWLLEIGYCSSIHPDIPVEALCNGKVFAITANATIIRRLIIDPIKRNIFEKVVDDYGLEHLIDIRAVNRNNGQIIDYIS